MSQTRWLALAMLLCAVSLPGCMTTLVTQKAKGGDFLDGPLRPPRAFALEIEAAALAKSGGALVLHGRDVSSSEGSDAWRVIVPLDGVDERVRIRVPARAWQRSRERDDAVVVDLTAAADAPIERKGPACTVPTYLSLWGSVVPVQSLAEDPPAPGSAGSALWLRGQELRLAAGDAAPVPQVVLDRVREGRAQRFEIIFLEQARPPRPLYWLLVPPAVVVDVVGTPLGFVVGAGALALTGPFIPALLSGDEAPHSTPESSAYGDAEIRSYLRAFDCPCALGLDARTTLRCFDPLDLRQHPELVIAPAR